MKQPEHRINGRHGGSHEFLRSPWIKHYKSLAKTQILVTDEGSSEPENQVVSRSSGKKGMVICSSGSASSLKHMSREGCSHSRDHDQISFGEGTYFIKIGSFRPFINYVVSMLKLFRICFMYSKQRYRIRTLSTKEQKAIMEARRR